MTINLTQLNFLSNLVNTGLGLMQLSIWIMIAMLAIVYALNDEGRTKDFVRPVLWALIVFSGLTWAGTMLKNKWSGQSFESMMEQSDQEVLNNN